MSLEQRLQHAARELREFPIETPPLGALPPRRRSFQAALVAPVLFALGGVVLVAGTLSTDGDPRPPAATSATTADDLVIPPAEEIEIIAGLVAARADAARPTAVPGPRNVV